MIIKEENLKAILLENGILDEKEFASVRGFATRTKKSISRVLVEKNYISDENLSQLIADFLKVPYVNLSDMRIPREILFQIPQIVAQRRRVIVFDKNDKVAKIALVDPNDLETINFVRKKIGLDIEIYLASDKSFRKALSGYKRSLKGEFNKIIQENLSKVKTPSAEKMDTEKFAQELPIIRVVDTLIDFAVSQDASDVHFEPLSEGILVRYRIDGILHDMMTLPKEIQPLLVARVKILANLKIDEHRKAQDGRFRVNSNYEAIAARVSIVPTYNGEKVVMRLLSEEVREFSLEELGLRGKSLERVNRSIQRPHGMVLATGPTGSGKTTTLYTIINIINKEGININTIEDPIEYSIDRVNQTQVDPKVGVKFSTGLRSLLRQDPDVIMIGEIRDSETARIGVNAAMTGHLVLSSLHTNDAPGALPRLLDMGIEAFLVASTVNVIIAQRLVRQICQTCITSYKLDPKEAEHLEKQIDAPALLDVLRREGAITKQDLKSLMFYRGKGCNSCNNTGYKGRIGIYEVLEVDDVIRDLIVRHTDAGTIKTQGKDLGMIEMFHDGFIKAVNGETTIEEILRVTRE